MKKILTRQMIALSLTLIMALSGLPIVAFAKTDASVNPSLLTKGYQAGGIVEFGSYPQTRVTDEVLLSILDERINGWNSYNYYSGTNNPESMVSSDYMQYTDVDYDGVKYRCVRFSSYRPNSTDQVASVSNSYQDDNGYFINNSYWFRFEPLRWRILDPTTGLVMCETIIDSQPFNNIVYLNHNGLGPLEEYSDPSLSNYSNNYANSFIRDWMNSVFYNTAFSSIQKGKMQSTKLDNSAALEYYSTYDAEPTTDKVFLLSKVDIENTEYGFSYSSAEGDSEKRAQGSDYAKCQGLYVSNKNSDYYDQIGLSPWRLRTAGGSSNSTCIVFPTGYYFDVNSTVVSVSEGIRPAIRLSLPLEDNYAVTGISVVPSSKTMVVDNSIQLTATVFPSNATNKSITWTSSDTTIASVKSTGVVTAKSNGVASITAKTVDGGFSASCTIIVTTPKYTIEFYDGNTILGSKQLQYGETGELSYGVIPSKENYHFVGWSITDGGPALFAYGEPVKNLTTVDNSVVRFYAVWEYSDTTKPTGSISSTNNVAESQTVTLSLSDDVGVVGYYWGTSSTYTNNTYTATSATNATKMVSSAGTYYLTVKDTSGNVSANYSVTFYKTTLNANGGSVSPTSVLTKSENAFTIPTPTRGVDYVYAGWNTKADGSGTAYAVGTKYKPASNTTLYAQWNNKDDVSIIVQADNGDSIGSGAVVELYDQSGKVIARGKTSSEGVCTFSKAQYNNARSVTAYKDTEFKGGPNRAEARAKYNNVVYQLRITSDYITSSGKWNRTPFKGKKTTLKLSSPKIVFNCSVSYFHDHQTGDYYADIQKAFRYVNQYLQEATDGYMELGKVAIFSTTDQDAFYRQNSVVAKCDVQVRQYSSDSWGSKVWPNSSIDGAFYDRWSGEQYRRVQMQKIAAGADISTSTKTWAKIVTHELGHYLFGFYDEYLNKDNEKWTETKKGMRRPTGSPSNYGLMEYQYTDLEMSVPKDYLNIHDNTDRFIPKQYYRRGMSCWEYFDKVFFDPNGIHVSIPQSDRTYEEITNTVSFYDCRSNVKAQASNGDDHFNKNTSMFVLISFQEGNLLLKTDRKIIRCTLADFGNEETKGIPFDKVTNGYRISLADIDEGSRFLTIESEEGINTFDLYNVHLPDENGFSNRNNSIFIQSDFEQECQVVVYNASDDAQQTESLGRVVALKMDTGRSLTLIGRIGLDGEINYSTLAWHKYENGDWIRIASESYIGEYSSIETKCNIAESGIYALIAVEKTASAPSLPSDQSFFTTESFSSKDGGIRIHVNYQSDDILGYRVQYQLKDRSETMTTVFWDAELIVNADYPNQKYDVDIWAILNNGTEVSLGQTQTVVSGEYYQEGSGIPFWWVVKHNLQENGSEIVDNKDYDKDGYTNLQEYRNGTDPTIADAVPEPSTITIHNYQATRTVDYRTTITFSADPVHNPVSGAAIHWFIDGQDTGIMETYTVKEAKKSFTVQIKYMKGSEVIAESESESVNVKTDFFARLKAFFRALFGRLPKIVQEYLGVEIIDSNLP